MAIPAEFSPRPDAMYEWWIRPPGWIWLITAPLSLSVALLAYAAIAAIVFGISWGLGQWHPLAAVAMVSLVSIYGIVSVVRGVVLPWRQVFLFARNYGPGDASKDTRTGAGELSTGAFVLALALLAAVAYRGSPLADGFLNVGDSTFWTWPLYLADNVITILLLDVPDVYDLHFSSIQPHTATARLITVGLRVSASLSIVAMLFKVVRGTAFARRTFKAHASDLKSILKMYWIFPAKIVCTGEFRPLTTPWYGTKRRFRELIDA
jgi:hypothetical protein